MFKAPTSFKVNSKSSSFNKISFRKSNNNLFVQQRKNIIIRGYAGESKDVNIDPSFVENQINSMLEKEENPHLNDWKKLGVPTQEKVYSFIRDHIGGLPKTYKPKYPNVTLAEIKAQIDVQQSRPIYGIDDPKFRSWVSSLGYSQEETNNIIQGRFPSFDSKKPQWDELTAVFSDSNTDMRSWKLISEAVNGILAPKSESAASKESTEVLADDFLNNGQEINWPEWEAKIGKDSVAQMKKSLDEAMNAVPNFATFDVSGIVKDYFNPLFEQMKDEIVDSIPQITELTDKIILAGEGKRIIEQEGFLSMDRYLDDFIPEIRNEVDLEIDNNDYDWEYNDLFKKDLDSKLPRDFIISKEALRDSIELMYEESSGDTVQISSHPEREKLIKEWMKEQDRSKRLEAELSTMKTTTEDQVHEEDHDKEESAEDKEEVESEYSPLAKGQLSTMFKLETDFWEKLATEEREARRKEREAKGLEKKPAAAK